MFEVEIKATNQENLLILLNMFNYRDRFLIKHVIIDKSSNKPFCMVSHVYLFIKKTRVKNKYFSPISILNIGIKPIFFK